MSKEVKGKSLQSSMKLQFLFYYYSFEGLFLNW